MWSEVKEGDSVVAVVVVVVLEFGEEETVGSFVVFVGVYWCDDVGRAGTNSRCFLCACCDGRVRIDGVIGGFVRWLYRLEIRRMMTLYGVF